MRQTDMETEYILSPVAWWETELTFDFEPDILYIMEPKELNADKLAAWYFIYFLK